MPEYCVLIATTNVNAPMLRIWPPGQLPTAKSELEAVERRNTFRAMLEAGLPVEGIPNEAAVGIAIGKYGTPPTIVQYDRINRNIRENVTE